MLQWIRHLLTGILSLYFLLISNAYSAEINLLIPIVQDTPKQHLFFHELIETALKDAGHKPRLVTQELPQSRIKHYMAFGEVSLFWMVESAERNKKYIPISTGLTNKLIGKRILFIKEDDQPLYDEVNNLQDFRNLGLVGVMGKNWFDVDVWKENNLKYKEEDGSWKSIFERIPYARGLDYFSRGINEILTESLEYPDLAIEQRLVLIYDRDFLFYLSKKGTHAGAPYKEIIEQAIKQAKNSGLIDRLIEKHWGYDFRILGLDERVKIHLKTPN